MSLHDEIITALKTVIDPELHFNIVDLGLVYKIDMREGGIVDIDLTLTTPACPLAPYIVARINEALVKVPGVEDARVHLVFDPPWSVEKINPSVRMELFPNYMAPEALVT